MVNRVSLPSSNTQLFLQLLLEEKSLGNWSGKSATRKGYENVGDKIRRITGIEYNKVQMKNKFDTLRGVFHLYPNMFSGQTGAGYDYATGNMTMPDSWWDGKIQENPAYKKFRKHGLEFGNSMYDVFGDSSANGAYQYSPTTYTPLFGNPSGRDETSGGAGDETPPDTPRLGQDVASPPRDVSGGSRLSGRKIK